MFQEIDAVADATAAAWAHPSAPIRFPGVRAGLINDHYSTRQGVEDDHMNIICLGGRVVGPMLV